MSGASLGAARSPSSLGVLVRVPFWAEALRTPVDGDTRDHRAHGAPSRRGAPRCGASPTARPLEAWLAAPLFALLGPDTATLRLVYFLLGLALIPAAYALARALDPRAALPAAILMACPSPYLLLLSALPPPHLPVGAAARRGRARRWPCACGAALAAGTSRAPPTRGLGCARGPRAVDAPDDGDRGRRGGVVALARAPPAAARALWPAVAALLAASAPWWVRALADPQALEMVSVSGRRAGLGAHLRGHAAAPARADRRPAGHARAARRGRRRARPRSLRRRRRRDRARLRARASSSPSAAPAAIAADEGATRARSCWPRRASPLLAFPFPLRSSPASIRFLTPAYLPVIVLVTWARGGGGRAGVAPGRW